MQMFAKAQAKTVKDIW